MPFSPFALDSCPFSTLTKDFSTHFAEDQELLRSFFSTLALEPTVPSATRYVDLFGLVGRVIAIGAIERFRIRYERISFC